MARLFLKRGERVIDQVESNETKTVLELLTQSPHWQRQGTCGGRGTCGNCMVQVSEGSVSDYTGAEYRGLTEAQRALHFRLACQVMIRGDATVNLYPVEVIEPWEDIDMPCEEPAEKGPVFFSLDLGSTTLRLSLLVGRRRLAALKVSNPQRLWGADILTRLHSAATSPANAEPMKAILHAQIQSGLDFLIRKFPLYFQNPSQTPLMTVVGNTAMLLLLQMQSMELLLEAEYWHKPVPLPAALEKSFFIQDRPLRCELVAPVAGFLGSDSLVGLMHTLKMLEPFEDKTILFMDIGTNTELALFSKGRLFLTAVPGGSVFDGHSFSCGMLPRRGAISGWGEAGYEVIGGGEPLGICGTGYLDLVASLLKDGIVTPQGRFADRRQSRYDLAGTSLFLSLGDLDLLQRAKAALAAGQQVLLNQAGLQMGAIDHIQISGIFGSKMNLANAIKLGLFIPRSKDQFHFDPFLALKGCEDIVMGDRDFLEQLRARIQFTNLVDSEIYDNLFVDNLLFNPMTGSERREVLL